MYKNITLSLVLMFTGFFSYELHPAATCAVPSKGAAKRAAVTTLLPNAFSFVAAPVAMPITSDEPTLPPAITSTAAPSAAQAQAFVAAPAVPPVPRAATAASAAASIVPPAAAVVATVDANVAQKDASNAGITGGSFADLYEHIIENIEEEGSTSSFEQLIKQARELQMDIDDREYDENDETFLMTLLKGNKKWRKEKIEILLKHGANPCLKLPNGSEITTLTNDPFLLATLKKARAAWQKKRRAVVNAQQREANAKKRAAKEAKHKEDEQRQAQGTAQREVQAGKKEQEAREQQQQEEQRKKDEAAAQAKKLAEEQAAAAARAVKEAQEQKEQAERERKEKETREAVQALKQEQADVTAVPSTVTAAATAGNPRIALPIFARANTVVRPISTLRDGYRISSGGLPRGMLTQFTRSYRANVPSNNQASKKGGFTAQAQKEEQNRTTQEAVHKAKEEHVARERCGQEAATAVTAAPSTAAAVTTENPGTNLSIFAHDANTVVRPRAISAEEALSEPSESLLRAGLERVLEEMRKPEKRNRALKLLEDGIFNCIRVGLNAVEFEKWVKLACELGVGINIEDQAIGTPLMYAIVWGRKAHVKILLKYGADPCAECEVNSGVIDLLEDLETLTQDHDILDMVEDKQDAVLKKERAEAHRRTAQVARSKRRKAEDRKAARIAREKRRKEINDQQKAAAKVKRAAQEADRQLKEQQEAEEARQRQEEIAEKQRKEKEQREQEARAQKAQEDADKLAWYQATAPQREQEEARRVAEAQKEAEETARREAQAREERAAAAARAEQEKREQRERDEQERLAKAKKQEEDAARRAAEAREEQRKKEALEKVAKDEQKVREQQQREEQRKKDEAAVAQAKRLADEQAVAAARALKEAQEAAQNLEERQPDQVNNNGQSHAIDFTSIADVNRMTREAAQRKSQKARERREQKGLAAQGLAQKSRKEAEASSVQLQAERQTRMQENEKARTANENVANAVQAGQERTRQEEEDQAREAAFEAARQREDLEIAAMPTVSQGMQEFAYQERLKDQEFANAMAKAKAKQAAQPPVVPEPHGAVVNHAPANNGHRLSLAAMLREAINKGDVSRIDYCIRDGVNVDVRDPNPPHNTSLMNAIQKLNLAMVKRLFKFGANCLAINDEGHTVRDVAEKSVSDASDDSQRAEAQTILEAILAELKRIETGRRSIRNSKQAAVVGHNHNHRAKVNAPNQNWPYNTPLMDATQKYDLAAVKKLLAAGADCFASNGESHTVRYIAKKSIRDASDDSQRKEAQKILEVISKRYNYIKTVQRRSGRANQAAAVEHNHVSAPAHSQNQNPSDNAPLMLAIEIERQRQMQEIQETEAAVRAASQVKQALAEQERLGQQLLENAMAQQAAQAAQPPVVPMPHGAIVNHAPAAHHHQGSPEQVLRDALAKNFVPWIDYCVAQGVNIDTPDPSLPHNRPLMTATQRGHLAMVQKLLGVRADRFVTNSAGQSALYFAAKLVADASDSQLENAQAVMQAILGEEGGRKEKEAAHAQQVAQEGAASTVRLSYATALKHALPDHPSKEEAAQNMLKAAALNGYDHWVAGCVADGANVNFADSTNLNNTPLMIATQRGHLSTIQALIGAGANRFVLNSASPRGQSALYFAAKLVAAACDDSQRKHAQAVMRAILG